MVKINPFRGYRPQISTQHDLFINPSTELLDFDLIPESPDSGVFIPKNSEVEDAQTNFKDMFSPDSPLFIEKAKKNWPQYISLGLLKQDAELSIYIYRMHRPYSESHKTQIGIFCLVSVKDLEKERILGHENTFDKPINKFVNRIDRLEASPSPVYLMYEDNKKIDNIISEAIKPMPIINFEATSGVRHTLWKVSDSNTINYLIKQFKKINNLYIADGHHRIKGAQKYAEIKRQTVKKRTGEEDYEYFLATLFPMSQLQVLEYNRIVKNIDDKLFKEFKKKIYGKFFFIKGYKKKKPKKKGSFGLYYKNKWYLLDAHKTLFKKRSIVKTLDAYILQKYIFDPIFNIKDPSNDENIEYVSGLVPLDEIEKITSDFEGVAFILYPMTKKDIFKVAKAKKAVPPKSTWFEPKLLKGIVVRILENNY
ncbi:MAG: DUF1015 domain-containing protein [Candidatus Hodarchaeales archaeon]|jgi:uncharacterized protein (DUF1015 family)